MRNLLLRGTLTLMLVAAGIAARGQSPQPQTEAQPSGANQGYTAASGGLDAQQIIAFLNQTVVWHRHATGDQRIASEAGDFGFITESRQTADQAARLSFDFAKAEAELLARALNVAAPQDPNSAAARYQRMLDLSAKYERQLEKLKEEIEQEKQKLEAASGKQRQSLQVAVAETQSEIDLTLARRDAVRNMAEFIGASGGGGTGDLRSQIAELERTIPPVTAGNAAPQNASPEVQRRAEPSGIISLITDLVSLRRRMGSLDESIALTDALAQNSTALYTPLRTGLREMIRRGDNVAGRPDTTDATALKNQKAELDALTAEFKQLSAALLPLSKQGILLDAYKRNLTSWRSAVSQQYTSELRNLIVRLAALALVLAVVVAVAVVWKRTIHRYVRDVRRQHQLMLMRRIVVWFLIAIIVAFAFSSELGSLATFAGLLTAGVAFALQNVILSVAGYFFLIGKYGVRVGDRVQVCGITGEVLDVGLIRLHLMEVGDANPTGRVVVFSNSVVFQPNAGFFKQIPGTNFGWHEITMTMASDSDYRVVEERLLGAVEAVFAEYGEKMEHQRRHLEHSVRPLTIHNLKPSSRLQLTGTGLKVIIRYPVELAEAGATDDRITRELLDAIDREPKLKVVASGTPTIQPVDSGQALAASGGGN